MITDKKSTSIKCSTVANPNKVASEFNLRKTAATAKAKVAPATFGISSIHGGQMAEVQIMQEHLSAICG